MPSGSDEIKSSTEPRDCPKETISDNIKAIVVRSGVAKLAIYNDENTDEWVESANTVDLEEMR